MEPRKITIVQTKNQTKSVIMSAATTIAELKRDLEANGIDYEDMTFFEGVSKSELRNDNSILPHDIPYKGTITNELVFMLTNTNKKIKSGIDVDGMTRSEIYAIIRDNHLQDKCMKEFSKNFTMCKTKDLIALIKGNILSSAVTDCNRETVGAVYKLVNILYDKGIIRYDEREDILDILQMGEDTSRPKEIGKEPASKMTPSYSDAEIDDMFAEI